MHIVMSDDCTPMVKVINVQLAHFTNTVSHYRGLELPDGIILRYTKGPSLYFYLHSSIDDVKIRTKVYSSDNPYDRQKASIGVVVTPMFDPGYDRLHLEKLEALVRGWVNFVHGEPDQAQDFQSFKLDT